MSHVIAASSDGEPMKRALRNTAVPKRESARHKGRSPQGEQEVVSDTGRKRIENQAEAELFAFGEVSNAVAKVMDALLAGVIPAERMREVAARLLSYQYEWLYAAKADVILARSRELEGALGRGEGTNARLDSLIDSVESHVSMLSRMIEAELPLPDPHEAGLARPKTVRSEIVTVRLTPAEMRKVKESAGIESKNVSQMIREMLVYRSSAPVEVEYKSPFREWIEERERLGIRAEDDEP